MQRIQWTPGTTFPCVWSVTDALGRVRRRLHMSSGSRMARPCRGGLQLHLILPLSRSWRVCRGQRTTLTERRTSFKQVYTSIPIPRAFYHARQATDPLLYPRHIRPRLCIYLTGRQAKPAGMHASVKPRFSLSGTCHADGAAPRKTMSCRLLARKMCVCLATCERLF